MAPISSTNSASGVIVAALILAATSIHHAPTEAFVPSSIITRRISAPLSSNNEILLPNSITSTSLAAIRRGGGRRQARKEPENKPPMNNEIKQTELRINVATKDGKDESLGIMSKQDALAKAQELGGLDLILINANSDPPVCKIVDYSKYRYMLEKKRKEKAKNSKATEVKEVKMSYKIGDHDYGVRLKAATKFIKQGNRVKATVMFRGREVQHDKLGVELLERLANDLEDLANMEGRPRREGRSLGTILSPRSEVVKAINDAKRQKEKEKKAAKAESLAKREEAAEAKERMAALKNEKERATVEDVLEGLDLDDEDEFDDDDIDDASLDDLLGSSKVADDLFA